MLFCHVLWRSFSQSFSAIMAILRIRDLLSKNPKQKLDLKDHPDGGVYVKDLTIMIVKGVRDLQQVMEVREKNMVTTWSPNTRKKQKHLGSESWCPASLEQSYLQTPIHWNMFWDVLSLFLQSGLGDCLRYMRLQCWRLFTFWQGGTEEPQCRKHPDEQRVQQIAFDFYGHSGDSGKRTGNDRHVIHWDDLRTFTRKSTGIQWK